MAIYRNNQPDYSQRKTEANGPVISYFYEGEDLERVRNEPYRGKDGKLTSWNSLNKGKSHSERSRRGSAERMKTLKKRKGNDAS